jgi:hypothetical protein
MEAGWRLDGGWMEGRGRIEAGWRLDGGWMEGRGRMDSSIGWKVGEEDRGTRTRQCGIQGSGVFRLFLLDLEGESGWESKGGRGRGWRRMERVAGQQGGEVEDEEEGDKENEGREEDEEDN